MSIPTLKIGRLSPNELQQLASITREVHCQTGQRFSLLDPHLMAKLKAAVPALGNDEIKQRLRLLARSLHREAASNHGLVEVECYRKYGVKVKYYDQSVA